MLQRMPELEVFHLSFVMKKINGHMIGGCILHEYVSVVFIA
jgi:hypothetical protein